jgi:hypothetical protein
MKVYNQNQTTAARQAAKEALNRGFIQWLVGFMIPADTQDDHKEKYNFVAAFSDPYDAQEYIDSRQNPDRLFITRVDRGGTV